MIEMELVMNLHAAKAAKGGIAEFIGHSLVDYHQANGKLTPGLWLVRSCSYHRRLALPGFLRANLQEGFLMSQSSLCRGLCPARLQFGPIWCCVVTNSCWSACEWLDLEPG